MIKNLPYVNTRTNYKKRIAFQQSFFVTLGSQFAAGFLLDLVNHLIHQPFNIFIGKGIFNRLEGNGQRQRFFAFRRLSPS